MIIDWLNESLILRGENLAEPACLSYLLKGIKNSKSSDDTYGEKVTPCTHFEEQKSL
jgi:hypothetical protein